MCIWFSPTSYTQTEKFFCKVSRKRKYSILWFCKPVVQFRGVQLSQYPRMLRGKNSSFIFFGLKLNMRESSKTLIDSAADYGPNDQQPNSQIPDRWDKVNSGIRLSYRHATPGYMAGGPVRQPYAGVDFISHSGICEFGYSFARVSKAKLLQRAFLPQSLDLNLGPAILGGFVDEQPRQ